MRECGTCGRFCRLRVMPIEFADQGELRHCLRCVVDDRRFRTREDSGNGRIVRIGDDHAAPGHALDRLLKRFLQRREIGKIIRVIKFDIRNHQNLGREFQKMIAIFARFDDKEITFASKKI